MWECGAPQQWLCSADPDAQRISSEVNGPLLLELASSVQWHDLDVVELFRSGGKVIGVLPPCGANGKKVWPEPDDWHALLEDAAARNSDLLASLRADPNAAALTADAAKDSALGRMSPIRAVQGLDLRKMVVARRFSREKGV